MATDGFAFDRFPRASTYHPDWIRDSVGGGANSLWLTEWLAEALELRPAMRVLDLGCGRGASSMFLHREFGVQVWATDLWFSAEERSQRIRDAGVVDGGVVAIHADARALPFDLEFFDAIVSIDSFPYYGTDDLYLGYLARFVKPGGAIGIAGAGLMHEIDGAVPEHLAVVDAGSLVPALGVMVAAALGEARRSSMSIWPTRCRTAGGAGSTGTGQWRRTTRLKSRLSKPTRAARLAMCEWRPGAGPMSYWTIRSCRCRHNIRSIRCCGIARPEEADTMAFRWLALAVFVGALFVSAYHRRRARERETIPRRREGGAMMAARALVAFPLFISPLAYVAHPPAMAWASFDAPGWLRWAGVGLGVVVIASVHWVLGNLGRNVSETVLTKESHELVTSGPYRWIRHPLYTTGIALFVALGLIAANWFILLCAAAALVGIRTGRDPSRGT